MKSAVLSAVRRFEIRESDKPQLERSTDVLLRVAAVGICGSDIHYFNEGRIGDQIITYPFTIGHECSAVVAAVGSDVKQVRTGDHVFVEPAVSCGHCDQCRIGRRHTCRHLKFLGCPGQLTGALSEYLIMPEENCYRLPASLSLEQAVLAEPLSIGLHAWRQAGSLMEKSIGIFGVGPIGLSVLLVTRMATSRPILVTDKIDSRLSVAMVHGADWTGNPDETDVAAAISCLYPLGLDIVFECCGKPEALDQAVDVLGPGGVLVLVGIPASDRISLDISKIRRKEISIVNVRRQNECVQAALDLLAANPSDFTFMITHRFGLADMIRAYDMVADYQDGVIKALIKMPGD